MNYSNNNRMSLDVRISILWALLTFLSLSTTTSHGVYFRSSSSCKSLALKRPTILTDPYNIIKTPNFPSKFETPYCMEWIIDAYPYAESSSLYSPFLSPFSSSSSTTSTGSVKRNTASSAAAAGNEKLKIIYLYLNQMYLKTNVTISAFHYSPFSPKLEEEDNFDDLMNEDCDYGKSEHEIETETEHPGVRTEYFVGYDYHTRRDRQQQQQNYDEDENILKREEYDEEDEITTNSGSKGTSDATEDDDLISSKSLNSSKCREEPPAFLTDDSSKFIIGPWDCARKFRIEAAKRRNGSIQPDRHYGFPTPDFAEPVYLNEEQLRNIGLIYTTCKYMSIKVEIWSPYTSHIRVRDHLLDVYGFNVSYEIAEYETRNLDQAKAKNFCSASLCNFNGHCRVTSDFQDFFCECHPERVGRNCEYDFIKCNPAKNLNFCKNGGTCRLFGKGHGKCYCPANFNGQLCEIDLTKTVKMCPGRRQCQKNCQIANLKNKTTRMIHNQQHKNVRVAPPDGIVEGEDDTNCSCESPLNIPSDWVLYKGTLQASASNLIIQRLPFWEYPSSSLSQEELQLKKRIESELIKKLEKLYIGFQKLDKVVVTSFSDEYKFSFHFLGPSSIENETILCLTELQLSQQLFPEFALERNYTPQMNAYKQVQIKVLNLNSEFIPLRLHADFTISCMAFGSKFVTFKWFKDEVEINDTLALRLITRFKNNYDMGASWRSTSVLHVDHSSTADIGTYTCQVSDLGSQEQCKDSNVVVTTQPVIEILPRSLTLVRNETGKMILCASTIETRNNYSYSWYKNGTKVTGEDVLEGSNILEVTERIYPYGLLLRIIKANESAVYTCKIQNLVGESSDDMFVEVLPSINSPSCRHEAEKIGFNNYELEWNRTGLDQTAKIRCPAGYKGFVQRRCILNLETLKPKWGNDDFSRCLSEELDGINATLRRFQAGFGVIEEFDDLLVRLNKHINGKGSLYSGEGEKIISVLNDVGQYALKKALYIKDSTFQTLFFQTASSLLKFPSSCVYEQSVVTLSNLIHKISTQFYNTSSRNVNPFQNDVVVTEHIQLKSGHSVIFPSRNHTYPKWLNVELLIEGAQHSSTSFPAFFITVLRNITHLLAKNTLTDDLNLSHHKVRRDIYTRTGLRSEEYKIMTADEIGSSIIYFSSKNYVPMSSTYFILSFTLSPELWLQFERKAINVSIGSLDDNVENGLSWNYNHHCILFDISSAVIKCKCDRFGQYALIVHNLNLKEEFGQPLFHWSILFGSTLCVLCCSFSFICILVHIHCSIGMNSIYVLKLLTCLSIIACICFAFPMKATSLSVLLTTLLCTCLILPLCCQLTKTLNVLFSTVSDLCTYFRSIPSIWLALLSTFCCTLPVWISATVYEHGRTIIRDVDGNILNNEPLKNESPIFAAFIAVMVLILVSLLIVYYKASFALKRAKIQVETVKLHIINYRLKTLNRSLVISSGILVYVSGIVLHDWSPDSLTYQYYYGFTATLLGFIIFFSYTIQSEYPIPNWLISLLLCTLRTEKGIDFEKQYLDMNRSSNNNNVVNTRTPQQAQKIFDDQLLKCNSTSVNVNGVEDHEELDEFEPCSTIVPRYRKNTYSSQASSEMETMETFTGGSSLISNNLSMQLIQQPQNQSHSQSQAHYQPTQSKNYVSNNSNGNNHVKRTHSSSSGKRPSIVSFKIPRAMTNPGTSSSSSVNGQGHGFLPNGSLSNGRFTNSNNGSGQNCCSSGCAKHNFQKCDNGSSNSNGFSRQRSNSNSMASLFKLSNGISNNTERLKPEREKCRLFGLDSDSASYVLPSTSTFSNSHFGVVTPGPISCLNSSRIPCRPGEDYQAYVPPNPQPQASLSSSAGSGNTIIGTGSGLSNSSSFGQNGGNSGTSINNISEYKVFPNGPRNGFNRELPLLPPPISSHIYSSIKRQGGSQKENPNATESYIYEEPDLPENKSRSPSFCSFKLNGH